MSFTTEDGYESDGYSPITDDEYDDCVDEYGD